MKITILGAGAMGSLFGGYLSKENEVYLVEIDTKKVASINEHGVRIRENDGKEGVYRPIAVSSTEALPAMDLLVVFVKAMYTEAALESNKHLIGKDTYLMTLQNGAGHEQKLLKFADEKHVIIGSTQHNSSLIESGYISHGGGGKTSIGLLGGSSAVLAPIAESFTRCGFDCATSDEVQKQIWNKLFLNTAASTLTGILQVPLGFIAEDANAHFLMEALAKEAVTVANAQGLARFDTDEVIAGIMSVLNNAKGGYTSIYADLKNGSRTEVDTIAGSVVSAAKAYGISVPYHEMAVALVHAMEQRNQQQ